MASPKIPETYLGKEEQIELDIAATLTEITSNLEYLKKIYEASVRTPTAEHQSFYVYGLYTTLATKIEDMKKDVSRNWGQLAKKRTPAKLRKYEKSALSSNRALARRKRLQKQIERLK